MNGLQTLLGVIVLLIVAVLTFVYSGVYNIAADEPHTAPVQWLLETTRTQSIVRRDDSVTVPADLADAQRVRRGAQPYASMCQVCHLGPGVKPTPLHQGLNPQPPRLAEEAGHHSPANLFWIIKHGIKMSGMPAWGETHDDEELWDIVAFIRQLPQMTLEQYQEITRGNEKSQHSHQ
jgi:mono/diheme cytochrome c family protein